MTVRACSTKRLYLGTGLATLLLILPGSFARGDEPTDTVDPTVEERKARRVIPIRERELWFPDAWHVRTNFGWATEKTLGEITSGAVRTEKERPWLIGLDVGRPIVENFRDWPLDFAWRIGLIRYFERDAQSDFWGHTWYVKAYWKKFPWSRWVRTRLGFGEGISYAWHVPREEREEARRHDRNTSRLLNYLDVSVDLNLGDLVRSKRLSRCWLGLVISHRSGAFGLIDIFGSVNGGSNYNTASVECEF